MSGPANSTKPTSSETIGGVYNVVPPVLQDGQGCALQLDINGNLKVSGGSGGSIGGSITANQVAFGSGANTIGGSANFTFDPTTGLLTVTSPSGAESLILVPNTGVGFQTTLRANGSGSLSIIPALSGAINIGLFTNGLTLSAATVAGTAINLFGAASGTAIIGPANNAGTPNRLNFPTTTGAAGTFLQTDGANPQQTSWVAAGTLIASGTATLPVGALAANTSSAATTVAGAGILATDAIEWSFNAAPGTGYTEGVFVEGYVTAGNVNFIQTNPTAGSRTPAAATLNWRVIR